MKRFLLAVLFSIGCLHSFSQPGTPEFKDTYRTGELLIMLQPGYSAQTLANSFTQYKLLPVQKASPEWNIWLFSFDPIADAEAVKNDVAKDAHVKIAQFNHNHIPLKGVPSDTLFNSQWDMTKISAPAAWDIDTGGFTQSGTQVVVATVDAGFDLSHPDISFWKNQLEIPDNGIDDDSDGYIDDYNGWNTVLNSDSIPVSPHGTFVAGISGATGNNTRGVSGVCWNIKAMPVVTNENNEASVVSAYSYIFEQRKLYNQTNGAKGSFVVATNSSFGPAGYGYQYPLWNAMYDSLGSIGILSAGATSNDASCNTDTCPDIPSQCASLYTVITTGTTIADVRHGGYGPNNVDIAAPGNGSYTIASGGGYATCGGTSAASPHVAGAIALMWSAACPQMLDDYKLHPDSLALLMKQYLLESVDTLPALIGAIVSCGRLNVYKALQKVQTYNCMPASVASEAPAQLQITAYPNPSAGKFCIDLAGSKETCSLIVYDAAGKKIVEYTSTGPHCEVDLSAQNSGFYLLKLNSGPAQKIIPLLKL